jgi:hypothetical protein
VNSGAAVGSLDRESQDLKTLQVLNIIKRRNILVNFIF